MQGGMIARDSSLQVAEREIARGLLEGPENDFFRGWGDRIVCADRGDAQMAVQEALANLGVCIGIKATGGPVGGPGNFMEREASVRIGRSCPRTGPKIGTARRPTERLDVIQGPFSEAFECDVRAGGHSSPSGLDWWLDLRAFAVHWLHMASRPGLSPRQPVRPLRRRRQVPRTHLRRALHAPGVRGSAFAGGRSVTARVQFLQARV